MVSSIIVQYREDDPHNPGRWRYGIPRHQWIRQDAVYGIRQDARVMYGTPQEAKMQRLIWEQQHPKG